MTGFESVDDAAVYRMDTETAIVFTLDFFPPVVDDPYDYGAIAAANSLSDAFAMGADPFLALNILSFPDSLPRSVVEAILRGGMEMARSAGTIVAGGHTMRNDQPFYGLAVLARTHPEEILHNLGAQPGDLLALTKPLGVGVITTALKRGSADAAVVEEAVGWMKRLNRDAGRGAVQVGAHACTDVTGNGLIGHLSEMLDGNLGVELVWESIPFHAGASTLAERSVFPGGATANSAFYSRKVDIRGDLSDEEALLLFSPETSGGLLIAVAPERRMNFEQAAQRMDFPWWWIGRFDESGSIRVV